MSTQVSRVNLFGQEQEVSTTDDYYTPPWVFETMGLQFDLDVSAPPGGIEWIPAKRYLTIKDDGLLFPWEGRVWMNPPYSRPGPWVDKFLDHGQGVALPPMNKSKWWMKLWSDTRTLIVPTPTNFKFIRNNDISPIPFQTALWAIGEEEHDAIRRVGKAR